MKKTIKGLWLIMIFVITFFIVPTAFADENFISIEYYEKTESTETGKGRIPIKNCVFGIIRVSEDLSLEKAQQEELLKSLSGKDLKTIEEEYSKVGKLIELKPTDENGKTRIDVEEKGIYYVFELSKKDGTNEIGKNAVPFFAIVGTGKNYIIYPKHIPSKETVELSVRKVWEGTKLDEVEIKLLANGKEIDTVFLSDNNNWKYTFKGLDKKDKNGKLIDYSVREVVPKGYTAKLEKDDVENGFVITNKKIPTKIIQTGDISHLYFIGSACILIAIGYTIYKKENKDT
ncbi:Cna B-type domain-containing protein [Parvimonas micra]|mgnify:CR=1 FL=1|uniref:Cna B-type domain-containing protein n=1 Tax=Parvimonas micra TaxID=33033 RepID=UPI002B485246|nr:Cna B-type domain-containing protein [Parvimonas micra]MEB3059619.1 Cna B-type domain-containing protein [Parvimonas micra]MEB3066086.1 Cna B-type domain-containing protein [Parvimonas micra]